MPRQPISPDEAWRRQQERWRRAALNTGSPVRVQYEDGETVPAVIVARSRRGYLTQLESGALIQVPSERILLPDDGG